MAVVIRMKRAGAKKRPFYRVVVADSRHPRDGRYIEQLGYYDPLTNPATFQVDAGKFEKWIRRGALPSESVSVMMAKHAPQALRPAPLPMPAAPEPAAEAPRTAPKARAVKPKAPAKKKAPSPRKGAEKKAKARAKAKTKKAAGGTKPKSAKKTKK